MDKYVFVAYNTDCILIEKFSNKIFEEGMFTRNYEEICYSIFFAIKYKFSITTIKVEKVLKTNNSIIYLLSFLYFRYKKNANAMKKLIAHAMKLSLNNDDFGQNWVFVYEVLSKNNLSNEWKAMKSKNVSFLKSVDQW